VHDGSSQVDGKPRTTKVVPIQEKTRVALRRHSGTAHSAEITEPGNDEPEPINANLCAPASSVRSAAEVDPWVGGIVLRFC